MHKRMDMGTDIAAVGVWDPGIDHTAMPDGYRASIAYIEAQARAGQLFYINTGGDGGYPVDIYLNEQPDPDTLSLYNSPDRAFLITSQTGRLIAGGLEDFGNPKPQITNLADIVTTAQRLVSYLNKSYVFNEYKCSTSVSIGVAIFPDDAEDAPTLMKNADMAMYEAKKEGRNTYKFFSQEY